MHGHCNAGITIASQEGWYDAWKMYLNQQGIRKLLSIPWLERDGYSIVCDAFKEWFVCALDGTKVKFQRDTGLCDRMLYLDPRQSKNEMVNLQTVRTNYKGYIRRDMEKAILAHKSKPEWVTTLMQSSDNR